MEERPGEIATSTAAALIGVSYEMVRRLVKSGHVAAHRRGFTTVPEAVQGYARFLREDAARAEANASAVRAHNAKAATVAAANARRRADLIAVEDAAAVLDLIAETACRQLRSSALAGRVPASVGKRVAAEMAEAAKDIEAARDLGVAVLKRDRAYDDE